MCSDGGMSSRGKIWNQPGETQKGLRKRQQLSLKERQAGRPTGNQERVQLEGCKSSSCPGEPRVLTTESVLQAIPRSLDFILKLQETSAGLSAAERQGRRSVGSSVSGGGIRGDRWSPGDQRRAWSCRESRKAFTSVRLKDADSQAKRS